MTTTVHKNYAATDTQTITVQPDIVIMGSEIYDITKSDDDNDGRATINNINVLFNNRDVMYSYYVTYTFTSPNYATASHTFNSSDSLRTWDKALTQLLQLKYPGLFLPELPQIVSKQCWIKVTDAVTDTVTVYTVLDRPAPSGHSIVALCLKVLTVDLEELNLNVEMLDVAPTDVDTSVVKTYDDLKMYLIVNTIGLD
jgi:hypothetical protein